MFWLRWLLSKTVRQATDLGRHARKHLNAQRDLLDAEAIQAIDTAIVELKQSAQAGADSKAIQNGMGNLETVANRHLKPYPHAWLRENLEVFLVVVALVLAFRTFFLQPFKIPTGSMQPTLYGITSENLKRVPNVEIPRGLDRVWEWFAGVSYIHIVADEDSTVEAIEDPVSLRLFNLKQRIRINGRWQTIWFPPDYGAETLGSRAELRPGQVYRKGEDIVKLKVIGGDHLFVDRMSYNFRAPRRGDIVVFETKGIAPLPQDQFYIKRLIGLPGETLSIGNDNHVTVDGRRLDASVSPFENVYGFDGRYVGHVNGTKLPGILLFPTADKSYTVRSNHYVVMGDNTMNSWDSRGWGDFSRDNVIGKAFCVYWPLSSRFGWGFR